MKVHVVFSLHVNVTGSFTEEIIRVVSDVWLIIS